MQRRTPSHLVSENVTRYGPKSRDILGQACDLWAGTLNNKK